MAAATAREGLTDCKNSAFPRQRRAESGFHHAPARTGLADDVEATVAVLYRTNAQSRTIEDALMREGLPADCRRLDLRTEEIKDALAYMRLVNSRRCQSAPRDQRARGIGKGVMEAAETMDLRPPTTCRCAAGLRRRCGEFILGSDRARARGGVSVARRARAVFRDLIVSLTEVARQDPVSIVIGRC